jgi:hypothetical protein
MALAIGAALEPRLTLMYFPCQSCIIMTLTITHK